MNREKDEKVSFRGYLDSSLQQSITSGHKQSMASGRSTLGRQTLGYKDSYDPNEFFMMQTNPREHGMSLKQAHRLSSYVKKQPKAV